MTSPLPPDIEDPDVRLQRLVEASRAIVLDTIPLANTKLSKFTLKQMSRRNKIKPGRRRSGLVLRRPRRAKAWQTKRKQARANDLRMWDMYYNLKARHLPLWAISKQQWEEEMWPVLEGWGRLRLGTYDATAPLDPLNCWIESTKTGAKLWEGAEERLRQLGYTL